MFPRFFVVVVIVSPTPALPFKGRGTVPRAGRARIEVKPLGRNKVFCVQELFARLDAYVSDTRVSNGRATGVKTIVTAGADDNHNSG